MTVLHHHIKQCLKWSSYLKIQKSRWEEKNVFVNFNNLPQELAVDFTGSYHSNANILA